jgi:hypothetical protein
MSDKKCVVVVGLLPAVARRVERSCPTLKLKFVEGIGPRPKYPSGDHIVVVFKFVPHHYAQTAFRLWPRDRVHLHGGGVGHLVDLLNGIAEGTALRGSDRRGSDRIHAGSTH